MNKINILNKNIYYFESTDPVIYHLKKGHLYGSVNFNTINKFIINNDPKSWIVDCGAHIGTFSFVPATESKNVLCIEAANKNVECLNATFADMSNVIVKKTILLDDRINCDFSSDYGPFGSATVSSSGNEVSDTLDNICEEHKIKNISCIKFDIEGNEISALLGAKGIISKQKPPMIIEVNGYALLMKNLKPQDLIKTVQDFGYNTYLYNNQSDAIIPISQDQIFPFCVEDMICLHKSKMEHYLHKHNISSYLDNVTIQSILIGQKQQTNAECKQYFDSL